MKSNQEEKKSKPETKKFRDLEKKLFPKEKKLSLEEKKYCLEAIHTLKNVLSESFMGGNENQLNYVPILNDDQAKLVKYKMLELIGNSKTKLMANFKEAYEIGRVNEGGYVNDPQDKGGETYSGVARNYWPKWEGWKIIDVIKKSRQIKKGEHIKNAELEGMIFNFYEQNFWKKILGDQIQNQSVANIFYDWTLTSGKARSEVQESLGLKGDGVVGPKTIAALNSQSPVTVFQIIQSARKNYYNQLYKANPKAYGKYINGWLNRANSFKFKA